MRWAWHEFFKTHDALIAPTMVTPGFEHDVQPIEFRTIEVDGVVQPYCQQIFWAGPAVSAYLPSTVAAGLGDDDLPIGAQMIGPEFGDLKTSGLARCPPSCATLCRARLFSVRSRRSNCKKPGTPTAVRAGFGAVSLVCVRTTG